MPALRAVILLFLPLLSWAGCAAGPETEGTKQTLFLPPAPSLPRLQFLRSISGSADVEPRSSALDSFLFGAEAKKERIIGRPYDCAVHNGKIFVSVQSGYFVEIDLPKSKIQIVEVHGRATLITPLGFTFADDGLLYVADKGRRQIVVLDEKFEFVREYGPFEQEARITDVAVHGERLYITNASTKTSQMGTVRVLDKTSGEEIMRLGHEFGADDTTDQFLASPVAVVVDEPGNVYVLDALKMRIFVWSPEGELVGHIGQPGNSLGGFARPRGLALNSKLLWVVDNDFGNCQAFDLAGRPRMFFGSKGDAPGQFRQPSAVWVGTEGLDLFADNIDEDFDAQKLVIVVSRNGPHRLSFFAFGRHKKLDYPDDDLTDKLQIKPFEPVYKDVPDTEAPVRAGR